jgi:nuclear pore complex protein Nup205
MATLLQDIKTSEEEDILLNKQTYDRELERFFFIIHYVYQGRPEAGMAFWNDPENNLYGFIQWAARNQTAFMVATFCYMLMSLACGVDCSEATYKFLLDEVVPGSNRSHRRGEPLTWSLIFKRIQVYLTALEARQRGMVSAPWISAPSSALRAHRTGARVEHGIGRNAETH